MRGFHSREFRLRPREEGRPGQSAPAGKALSWKEAAGRTGRMPQGTARTFRKRVGQVMSPEAWSGRRTMRGPECPSQEGRPRSPGKGHPGRFGGTDAHLLWWDDPAEPGAGDGGWGLLLNLDQESIFYKLYLK